MWSQVRVQQNIKAKDLEANVPIFVTATVGSLNWGLVSYAGLDSNILYPCCNFIPVVTILLEPLRKLTKVPLGCVFIFAFIFNVVISFFIDRVICQMNKPFLKIFRVVTILLSGKSDKAFFEHENFQRFKTCDQNIYS